jgi:hypothetical protein
MALIFVVVALVVVAMAFGLVNLFFPAAGRTGTILNWTAVVCLCLGLLKAFDWLRDVANTNLLR